MCEMGKVMTDERIEANCDSGDDAAKKTVHERAREMRKRNQNSHTTKSAQKSTNETSNNKIR